MGGEHASAVGQDLALQQNAAERQHKDYVDYFLPTARASVKEGEKTWDFAGRQKALNRIVSWLTHPGGCRPGLVLSGRPGSGKTAVLGLIATLANPRYQSHVPADRVGVGADTIPPANCFDRVRYAAGLSAKEVADALESARHVAQGEPPSGASSEGSGGATLTVLIDAVDEAADPQLLIDTVLKPRLRDGTVRMVLGIRTELANQLSDLCETIDLDGDCADQDALRSHVEHVLLQATASSPLRGASPDIVSQVVEGLVRVAGPSFLIGRLLAQMLAGRPAIPDLASDWESELPQLPGKILEQDLTERLGPEQAERAFDLLRPLAFAEGRGLPDEDIWVGLAVRLTDPRREYDYDDLMWLREYVGSYAVRSSDGDHMVYQPHHITLSEYLRAPTDQQEVHRRFVDFLLEHTPVRPDGTRDWSRASFYTRSYLATHIAKAGGHEALAQLLLDPGYLLCADPYRLLGALANRRPAADSPMEELRTAIGAYRQAALDFRRLPPALHPAALDLAARSHRASTLLSRMPPVPETSAWRARWVNMAPPRHSGYSLTTLADSVSRLSSFRHEGDQWLAVVSRSGELEVWNLDQGHRVLRATLRMGVAISGLDTVVHDGRVYLAVSNESKVLLLEVFGGEEALGAWDAGNPASDGETTAVAFAVVDDRLVLHVLDDGWDVDRFDVAKLTRLPTLRLSENYGFRTRASVTVTTTGDGASVAVIGTWGAVHLADLRTGQTSRVSCRDAGAFVTGVCLVPRADPIRLVAGIANHRIEELSQLGPATTLRRCPESVRDVDVHLHHGKPLVVAAYDRCDRPLEVFSLDGSGFSVSDFYDVPEAIYQVRVVELHHDRWVVVAGDRSGRVRVWDFPEVPA
ncbi:hypothetical protein [Streptomyces phaeochromogenes]|uniref:hypothetical protein n=1 Tax=Streptomyces phaeochromogenes TaxID=1923 RepID=UPI002E12920D|nr:hypothetical protein OG437_41160 [Streptomyces phaeochromogenes]